MSEEKIERKLWSPDGLVFCRSCGESRWNMSLHNYSLTGLEVSSCLCRECYDLCIVRHVKYADPHFIMAEYWVACVNPGGATEYRHWKPGHSFLTVASMPNWERKQPRLPSHLRKGRKR